MDLIRNEYVSGDITKMQGDDSGISLAEAEEFS
jgi:hypothetical protein